MNERIKELAEQAGFSIVETQGTDETTLWSFDDEPIDDELQKFAELIVRECEQVSLKNSRRDDDMGAIIARNIKQHFGVE